MSKPEVYISCHLVGDAVERLREQFEINYRDVPVPAAYDEIVAGARSADVYISQLEDSVNASLMDSCPKLKVIANVAVGYDNIDVTEATTRNILVLNTPGVLTNATADLAFSLLLSAARRIAEADRYVRAGKWKGWSSDFMLGRELANKTLGIVGMGRIGEAVAKRARAFDMNVIYTRRGNEEKEARLRQQFGASRVSLGELLTRADFVSVHTPLAPETRHLIGKTELAGMKPNCILVNTARGAVVDQQALIAALQNGQIAGAGLDVFEGEPDVPPQFFALENVVLSPHIGSATVETRSAMSDLVVNGVLSAFDGKLPDNAVNPTVWPATQFAKR